MVRFTIECKSDWTPEKDEITRGFVEKFPDTILRVMMECDEALNLDHYHKLYWNKMKVNCTELGRFNSGYADITITLRTDSLLPENLFPLLPDTLIRLLIGLNTAQRRLPTMELIIEKYEMRVVNVYKTIN